MVNTSMLKNTNQVSYIIFTYIYSASVCPCVCERERLYRKKVEQLNNKDFV